MTTLYLGLMSGTSLDGIDGVLVDLPDGAGPDLQVRAHVHHGLAPDLASSLLALNTPGDDELHRGALAANALARAYAAVVRELLDTAGVSAREVAAIGAHGQTVRHRPLEFDGTGYTVQLLNGALLAELAGIDVVCDLRSRDVAAGGQGAPLVPAFHRAVFGGSGGPLAVLNLGGIANLTMWPDGDGAVTGFDCGPANVLLDAWCRRHRGEPYDAGGRWAASGRPDEALLQLLLAEPYFALPPPKSTGRDLFHLAWLDAALARLPGPPPAPVDVQATLAELTAHTCIAAVLRHGPGTQRLLVCGGGAFNGHLMNRLRALGGLEVAATTERGLPPDQVEACAFAWLAARFVRREPGNLPAVTGARGPRLLGALHPAGA